MNALDAPLIEIGLVSTNSILQGYLNAYLDEHFKEHETIRCVDIVDLRLTSVEVTFSLHVLLKKRKFLEREVVMPIEGLKKTLKDLNSLIIELAEYLGKS